MVTPARRLLGKDALVIAASVVALVAVVAVPTAIRARAGGAAASQHVLRDEGASRVAAGTSQNRSTTSVTRAATAILPVGTPRYLPPGAVEIDAPSSELDRPVQVGFVRHRYQLPGSVNAHNIGPEGVTPETEMTAHTATVLSVTVQPGAPLEPPDLEEEFWNVTPILFDRSPRFAVANKGYLATFKTGYGHQIVTFSDGVNLYTVSCPRYSTHEGPSGIDVTELQRVAESVVIVGEPGPPAG